MKYRNHARVRAATRAGEPVPPCARAVRQPRLSPLADQPAKSSPSVASCTLVERKQTRISPSRRFARGRRIFVFQFRRGVRDCALELWAKLEKCERNSACRHSISAGREPWTGMTRRNDQEQARLRLVHIAIGNEAPFKSDICYDLGEP